ncbi:MAG: InlB B-repeat-containing protein [Spirochaetales bacterium]|nr:InlB B-repeat-containing protein [Spirochaetales bacterium]
MNRSTSWTMVIIAVFAIMSVSSCIYDPNMTNQTKTVADVGSGSAAGKITSLQMAIDMADEGSSIDLNDSKYLLIDATEMQTATVNKSLTISNLSLNSSLNVISSGVTLDAVRNASVTTNSSLKIAGSSLSSLTIAGLSSSANGNVIVGRGDTQSEYTAPPKVILENTTVGTASVSIDKTLLSIEGSNIKDGISLDGNDVQLSVKDTKDNNGTVLKKSTITGITFSKPCQVVLEDGTSDDIATPKALDNADAAAAATQIDMTSGSPTLERLSVLSGMPVFVKYGTLPDFSSLIVLGEYSVTAGVTIYKGDFCYDGDNNKIYKSESDFTVKIGDQTYYENGSVKSTVPLSSGQKDVIISKGSVTYSFKINVGEEEAPAEKKPILKGIEIKNGADINQNVYHVGDVFSLKGLVVEGTYSYGDNNTYTSVLTGWTSVPSDGTVITAAHDGSSLTVKYGSVSAEITNFITLSNDYTFTFVPYPETPNKDIVVKYVANGHTVSALTGLSRPDYKFEGWWTSLDNGETLDATFDFTNSISADTVVYAKWIEITGGNGGGNHSGDSIPDTPSEGTYRIIFSAGENGTEFDGTMEPMDVSRDVTIDLPECAFSMRHNSFVGWNTRKDGKGDSYWDKSSVVNLAAAGETVTLWAQWTENPKFFIYYHNDQDSENNRIQMVYKDVTNDEFESCQWLKDGNEFLYWTINLDTNDVTFDSGMTINTDLTGDGGYVHLYPVWKPKTWTIEYKDQNNQPFSGSDNTSDWVKKYTYGTGVTLPTTSTKQYYDFGGWHLSADCTDDAINGIDGHAVYPGDTITLYAKWTPNNTGSTPSFYTIHLDNSFTGQGSITGDMSSDLTVDCNEESVNLPKCNWVYKSGTETNSKEIWSFRGWSKSNTDLTVDFSDEASIQVNVLQFDSDYYTALYAVWDRAYICYSDGTFSKDVDTAKNPIGVALDMTNDNGTIVPYRIVSLNENSSQWYSNSTGGSPVSISDTTEDDGLINWNKLTADQSIISEINNYPVYKACNELQFADMSSDGYGIDGKWYIPALGELRNIGNNLTLINNSLNALSSQMSPGVSVSEIQSYSNHWSSTFGEGGSYPKILGVGDTSGQPVDGDSTSTATLRAVARFKAKPNTP